MCVVGFGRESDQDTRDNTMNKKKKKKTLPITLREK